MSVGYGNTLCVYVPETLRLRCVLSAPGGLDGAAKKVTINLPEAAAADEPQSSKKKHRESSAGAGRAQLLETRRKMLQLIKSYLDDSNDNSKLVKEITNKMSKCLVSSEQRPSVRLTMKEQELVHKKIMAHNELNFDQKISVFTRMRLHSKGQRYVQQRFNQYLSTNVERIERIESQLVSRAYRLSERHRYAVNRNWFNYRHRLAGRVGGVRVRDIFNFSPVNNEPVPTTTTATITPRKRSRTDSEKGKTKEEETDKTTKVTAEAVPVQSVPQIKHVVFGTGEYAHLLIMCTESRLLVWNLLTLRLQTAVKLSVHRLVIDPYTSLVAAFTKHNELYVFLPSVPMLLYQRKNMPSVFGAAWIPRRYPKSQSLNLDWQATSQLFFLSEKQVGFVRVLFNAI